MDEYKPQTGLEPITDCLQNSCAAIAPLRHLIFRIKYIIPTGQSQVRPEVEGGHP